MVNYSISSYTLKFQSNYKKLDVFFEEESTPCDTFDLEAANECVSVSVVDGEYIIGYESDFEEPKLLIDTPAGSTLSFDGCKMGGIGVVDLRDMKVGGPFNLSYEFDLECCAFKMKYVAGPFPFNLFFEAASCMTYTEL